MLQQGKQWQVVELQKCCVGRTVSDEADLHMNAMSRVSNEQLQESKADTVVSGM